MAPPLLAPEAADFLKFVMRICSSCDHLLLAASALNNSRITRQTISCQQIGHADRVVQFAKPVLQHLQSRNIAVIASSPNDLQTVLGTVQAYLTVQKSGGHRQSRRGEGLVG